MFTKKLVALDIGGVCISLHTDSVLRGFGLTDDIFRSGNIKQLCMKYESGKMTDEKMIENMRRFSREKLSDADLITVWNSMLGEPVPGMKNAMENAVKRGWKFVYFSNTSAIHMDYYLKNDVLRHLISGFVFSYQIGAIKPQSAMFEAFEQKYGIPEYYFDDSLVNVEAGRSRGWNAVQFRSPEQINQLLK